MSRPLFYSLQAALLTTFLSSGCTTRPALPAARAAPNPVAPNPYSPKPTDVKWNRGGVEIQNTSLVSSGGGISTLTLEGDLPTPCHELRLQIPDAPDAQGVLRINAWSVSEPGRMCAQMLRPFSVQVQLQKHNDTTVLVNGHPIRP